MFYQFKKLMYATDNDFALHILIADPIHIENLINDKKLKLILDNKKVTLDEYVQAVTPNDPWTIHHTSVNYGSGFRRNTATTSHVYERYIQMRDQFANKSKFKI